MKTKNIFLILLATGLAGAVFATLSTVVFPPALGLDRLMAVFYSIALLLFAARDYARRPKSILLLKSAPLLRPTLRITIDARKPLDVPTHRSAYTESNAA